MIFVHFGTTVVTNWKTPDITFLIVQFVALVSLFVIHLNICTNIFSNQKLSSMANLKSSLTRKTEELNCTYATK